MRRILIVFAHPAYNNSHANRFLLEAIGDLPHVTVHDLYQNYPDMFIDIKREQQLLLESDILLFQHPFYWYSAPALLKEWFDLVLEHGFAYGSSGQALQGKLTGSVITTGGTLSSYCSDGYNRYPIQSFLLPYAQMSNLCGMHYLAPFIIDGNHKHRGGEERLRQAGETYRALLQRMGEGCAIPHFDQQQWMEQALEASHGA